jgi:hypothetical protein
MQGYITIKEASELTGKHPDTIRRLWKGADNRVIDELKAKYTVTGKGGVVLVNKELIVQAFGATTEPVSGSSEQAEQVTGFDNQSSVQAIYEARVQDKQAEVDRLAEQLKAKDLQIAEFQKQSDQFQRIVARLQLPAGSEPTAYAEPVQTEVVVPKAEAKPKAKPRTKAGAKQVAKPKAKKSVKKQVKAKLEPKRRWWRI